MLKGFGLSWSIKTNQSLGRAKCNLTLETNGSIYFNIETKNGPGAGSQDLCDVGQVHKCESWMRYWFM